MIKINMSESMISRGQKSNQAELQIIRSNLQKTHADESLPHQRRLTPICGNFVKPESNNISKNSWKKND